MNLSLVGKRALVTGGASGIGRATALALAAEGASIVIADNAPIDRSEMVVLDIKNASGAALAIRTDVSDEAAVLALFDAIASRLDRLDILVNNAGILIEKPLLDTTAADFDRLMAVNLKGAFLVGREALRMMVRQGSGSV